jgi:arylsulfatase A-like enzyme
MINDNDLSMSDFYETPNIERIAEKGVIFSNAYASAPVCAPSRYSIQFGQTPARLKMIRVGMNTDHIDHNKLSIPKQLKEINSEYRSAHFGKWGMDSTPENIGYDKSDGPTKNKDGVFNYNSNKLQWSNNESSDPKKIFSITKRAINFIEENKQSNTPFFLQISHYAIHSDIVARKETYQKFKNKNTGEIHNNLGLAAMTFDLDDSVGLILDKLEELNLTENTYVIYTSDNGSVPIVTPRKYYKQSYNFPLQRGKWDAMEGGIRVPFIVMGPGINERRYTETPISFSDLLPTISEIAGNKILNRKNLDGGSFKKLLFNKSDKVFRKTKGLIFHVPYENKIALERAHSSIIVDNYKLIKFYDNNDTKLYDVKNDISESIDLSKIYINERLTKKLEKILDNYLEEVKAPKWQPGITWKENPLKIINSYH